MNTIYLNTIKKIISVHDGKRGETRKYTYTERKVNRLFSHYHRNLFMADIGGGWIIFQIKV